MMELLEEGARRWGLDLASEALAAFQTYYEELIDWNEQANLTTITDYQEVQIKHFLDSLSCLLVLAGLPLERWRGLDIGAGAGFPGLPLKIARPQIDLTLLEPKKKRLRFLQHLVERLELPGVATIEGRAEELGHQPGHREGYDLVFARAVATLPVLLEYALPLCRIGGIFLAQKGPDIKEELEASGVALKVLGGRLREVKGFELPHSMGWRNLVVVEKVVPTPEKYPRRPGVPAKRPLV
ncbi:MAG: 16S rRNA (guanine(527)-N(7))-methyltransferase RsmG [Chloroflexota bacterium]|nr:16S rRNA (guanine(527)-N(7))-methyltransferase RsmG [Chloroflexota bacterium]